MSMKAVVTTTCDVCGYQDVREIEQDKHGEIETIYSPDGWWRDGSGKDFHSEECLYKVHPDAKDQIVMA